jgi:hypothetical protein
MEQRLTTLTAWRSQNHSEQRRSGRNVSLVNEDFMYLADASQRAISTDTSAEDFGEQPGSGTVHRTYRPQE